MAILVHYSLMFLMASISFWTVRAQGMVMAYYNLFSVARSNRVFLPGLITQGSGHVINTASASGLLGYGFDRLPYVASKHAIVGMSEALATYLGPKGVGVTCLCPSGVITNILEGITAYGEVGVTPVAPAHRIVSAEDVGNLTAPVDYQITVQHP